MSKFTKTCMAIRTLCRTAEELYVWSCMEEPCDVLASHSGRRNTPIRFIPPNPEISAGLMAHLSRMQTLPLNIITCCLITPKHKIIRGCSFHSPYFIFFKTSDHTVTELKISALFHRGILINIFASQHELSNLVSDGAT